MEIIKMYRNQKKKNDKKIPQILQYINFYCALMYNDLMKLYCITEIILHYSIIIIIIIIIVTITIIVTIITIVLISILRSNLLFYNP